MKKFRITIEGVAPLRMNRLTESDKEGISTGANLRKMSIGEHKERAKERLYLNQKGEPVVLAHALEVCITNGGKKVKYGRMGTASKLLEAILAIMPKEIPLNKAPEFVEGTVRIPPKTGARVIKYWPYFPEWELTFEAHILDDRFPDETLRQSIIEAGIYAGLLDGRPKWGRFMVKEFTALS